MARIFVSYAHANEDEVQRIVGWLRAAGHQIWWDQELLANRRFSDSIEDQLHAADAVLVLWSKDSASSEWVRAEADIARMEKKLVQVSLDGSLPPIPFNQFHCQRLEADEKGGSSDAWNKILAALDQSGNRPSHTGSGLAPETGPVSRRSVLIAGAAGTAALAAGGYYAWSSGVLGTGDASRRLAVLPFRILGDAGDQTYLAEGFAAEIRAILARNPLLHVAAKVSSSAFQDQDVTAGQICQRLGVDYLLNGEISLAEGRLIGAAEFVEGATDRVLRPFDINFPIENILIVQQQIVSEIVEQISGEDTADARKMEVGGTRNVAAFDAFLRGEELYELGESEETDRAALAEFDKAIALDPKYAAAHAMRSRTLGLIGNLYGGPEDQQRIMRQSIESARTAIAAAPDFADGYAALGFALSSRQLDMKASLQPYDRAYELGAGDADILSRYALFRGRLKDFASSRAAIESAAGLDPLNARVFRFYGSIEYYAGNYSAALARFEKALELQAGLSSYHYLVGLTQLVMGELQAAKQSFEAEDFFVWNKLGLAIVEEKLGNRAAAERHFAELREQQGDKSLYQYLQIYAQWGDSEKALAALDRAWETRDPGLVQLFSDPLLVPLHGSAQFKRVAREMGFV